MPSLANSGLSRTLYDPFPGCPLHSVSKTVGPFYVCNAYSLSTRNGINPGPRVALTLKSRDWQQGEDDEFQAFTVMLTPDEQRLGFVEYFKSGKREPIGPCIFVPKPGKGTTYYSIEDWTPALELEVKKSAGELYDGDTSDQSEPMPERADLDELPF